MKMHVRVEIACTVEYDIEGRTLGAAREEAKRYVISQEGSTDEGDITHQDVTAVFVEWVGEDAE